MPDRDHPAYFIRMHEPGELRRWLGATSVAVDARTGEIMDIYDTKTSPIGNRIMDTAFSIHNGEIVGLLGRIVVFLIGLSLPVLYVTGLWAWFRKVKLRTQKRGRVEAGSFPDRDRTVEPSMKRLL